MQVNRENLWSDWRHYPGWKPDCPSFKETLDGGQAFCWFQVSENSYEGIVVNIPLRLKWESPHHILWSSPQNIAATADTFLKSYLGEEASYQKYYDNLPWRSDQHLNRCMKQFPKLRILNQPVEETLLGFLCSATKQIVQIKEMLKLLRQRFGQSVATDFARLPTWHELTQVSEQALRDCKFGFRAANIIKSAAVIEQSPDLFKNLSSLSYSETKKILCTLPGVGEKVADCVTLFGCGKLDAFPVDTWITKAMKHHYRLEDWKSPQIGHFGRKHFGNFAGLAQQFLFAWERNQSGK